jgi:hypothetical protein
VNDPAEYTRAIESYLCKKNDGHLIRIVGPAFEQVCGWAAKGIPLNVSYRGIDRYFERYYAKGPRRRPVRVEFCEADVFDVFDEWRRATGVSMWDRAPASGAEASAARPARHDSLPAHLERAIARLTALRSSDDRSLADPIDGIVRELDAARATAKGLRGAARDRLLARLRQMDADLLEAARGVADADVMRALHRQAEEELAPFRERMPRDAYDGAVRASIERLLRDRLRLPVIACD